MKLLRIAPFLLPLVFLTACTTPEAGNREVTTLTYVLREDDELHRLRLKLTQMETERTKDQLTFETEHLAWKKKELELTTRNAELELELAKAKTDLVALKKQQAEQEGAAEALAKLQAEQAEIDQQTEREKARIDQSRAEQEELAAEKTRKEAEQAALNKELEASSALPTAGTIQGTLKVASRNGDARFSQVMVRLERGNEKVTPPPHTHTVDMVNKKFLPKFLIVRPGDQVLFKNLDPFKHNVFSLSPGNQFDLGLYDADTTPGYTFKEQGVVKVYCNVHPEMACFVMVTDNPWIYQTDGSGQYTFDDLEPGTYTLYAWSIRGDYEKEVEVKAGQTAQLDFTIDGSRYKGPQHKNKFGKDYPNRARNERY